MPESLHTTETIHHETPRTGRHPEPCGLPRPSSRFLGLRQVSVLSAYCSFALPALYVAEVYAAALLCAWVPECDALKDA